MRKCSSCYSFGWFYHINIFRLKTCTYNWKTLEMPWMLSMTLSKNKYILHGNCVCMRYILVCFHIVILDVPEIFSFGIYVIDPICDATSKIFI